MKGFDITQNNNKLNYYLLYLFIVLDMNLKHLVC